MDGCLADLRYGPEGKSWALRRVGEVLSFGGDDYKSITITQTTVMVERKSNNKKWAVEHPGTP